MVVTFYNLSVPIVAQHQGQGVKDHVEEHPPNETLIPSVEILYVLKDRFGH